MRMQTIGVVMLACMCGWQGAFADEPGTKRPGNGATTDPAVVQVAASLGQAMANNAITHNVWRTRSAMLLDDIGPAILLTHGDGAVFAWVAAAERPNLVKGVAVLQPAQSLQGQPSQRLARLAKLPVAIVSPEASPSSATDPAVATSLRDIGCIV